MLLNSMQSRPSQCMQGPLAVHRELGEDYVVDGEEGPMGRQPASDMPALEQGIFKGVVLRQLSQ